MPEAVSSAESGMITVRCSYWDGLDGGIKSMKAYGLPGSLFGRRHRPVFLGTHPFVAFLRFLQQHHNNFMIII